MLSTLRLFLFALISLIASRVVAGGLTVPEALRTWAMYEATFSACADSGDLEKASGPKQQAILNMSVEVMVLSNRLHDPLKHRLEIVSYDIALKQFRTSSTFKKQLLEQRGGPCDYGTLSQIQRQWQPVKLVIENLINR